ncbi:TIGR01777 family oxidoreductase [Massilia sp. Se16.2.3]|uniref:TIGR01777 family oxidoreductase n=1 Tax=Massilia sp. Se16.2.3 TaxID=2709303 RepID=UPI0028038245|nr:TIGR01777 family oxidoreductase [Massilia sp. Se16.2.3]
MACSPCSPGLCGIGVGVSGVRDGLAARALGKQAEQPAEPVRFADTPREVLVTGATGFIGQKLVAALLADGHRVTVLTRQARAAAWMFNGRIECIASMDALPRSRRFDLVVNLAGAPVLGWRWSAGRRAVLRRSRVSLTQKLVDWIATAEHKPALLLSASAIGYYGVQARGDDRALTEDAPPQPIFMSDLCREWEEAARGAQAFGVQVARMRIGVVLGRSGALPMMLLPVKLGIGGPLGDGRQWLSWIHVNDVIAAMGHLARRGEGGAFNLVAPESVSQAQFGRTAARVHRRPFGFPTPGLPMRAVLGEQADLLLEGQRVLPERLLAGGFSFRYPHLEGALRSLAG